MDSGELLPTSLQAKFRRRNSTMQRSQHNKTIQESSLKMYKIIAIPTLIRRSENLVHKRNEVVQIQAV